MSKNTATNTAATGERELTEAELNHVSGGRGEAPVKYMEFKLKQVVIAGAAEANKEEIS